MRISNPKLFNGQPLVTQEQVKTYIAGLGFDGAVTGVPTGGLMYANSVLYSTTSGVLKDVLHVSGALDTINSEVDTINNALDAINDALNDINSRDDQTAVVSPGTNIASVPSSDLGNGVIKYTVNASGTVVSGTGLAEVTSTKDTTTNITTYTVDVPSAVAFANHDIQLSGVAAPSGYASSYQLIVDGVVKGDTINIPKDQYLSGVTYNEVSNSLEFAWKLKDNEITTTSVRLTDLIEAYKSGNKGIAIDGDTITLQVAAGDNYITINENGLASKGIDNAINAAVSGANAKLAGITDTVTNYVQGQVSGANAKLEGITDTVTNYV